MADNSQEQKDEQLKKDIENVEKSGIDSEKKDGVHKVKESRGKVIFDAFDHIKKREFKEGTSHLWIVYVQLLTCLLRLLQLFLQLKFAL